MSSREGASYSGFSKKSALVAGFCLALISGGIALFFCFTQMEDRRSDILLDYERGVNAWLDGAADAVHIWNRDMKETRSRISASETYRLFASDLYGLDKRVAGNINSADNGVSFSGSAAVLSEEVPAIRRILLEFMNYNGMLDVRLVNPDGQTILSALSSPAPLSPEQRAMAEKVTRTGETGVLPVHPCPNGLALDVVEPVLDLDVPDRRVAVFLSSTPVLSQLTQFLARPKPDDQSPAFAVQLNGNAWEKLQVPAPAPVPADINGALNAARGKLPFGLRSSLAGNGDMVYSMSTFIPDLNWSIVHETPVSVMERRISRSSLPVYGMGALAWVSFMLVAALLWWIGLGRQQRAVANEMQRLHQLVSRQKELLDSVNISLDIGLFMADVKGQIRVCNRSFAAIVDKTENDLNDQTLFSCFPVETASDILGRIRQVAINKKDDNCELYLEQNGEKRLFRVTLFPFLDASEESARRSIRGAVVTMKDITEFRRNSDRMRRQQEGLIEAFVRAEESVDPYLAGHSHRMATLGKLVARGLAMDEDGRNTVVMGAMLSQIGKLFIPRELLGKKGKLSAEELAEVHKAPDHAYRLLEKIDFNLPIARALHEMYENMDGTGYPQGLSGADILPEARVLAVLNAFCAMVSQRSYREGMNEKKAVEALAGNPCFDQTVVAQLKKVLETPEGALAATQ